MSRQDPEAQNLTADDFEYRSDEDETPTNQPARPARPAPQTFKSQYTIQTSERLKGVANRIIFSRYYILFYFIMMSLSLTTVVLSLMATRESSCYRVMSRAEEGRQGNMPTASLAYFGSYNQWDDGSRGVYKMGGLWQGKLGHTGCRHQGADNTEIPNDDPKCPGSVTGRILLVDLDTGIHLALFGGHKRSV